MVCVILCPFRCVIDLICESHKCDLRVFALRSDVCFEFTQRETGPAHFTLTQPNALTTGKTKYRSPNPCTYRS